MKKIYKSFAEFNHSILLSGRNSETILCSLRIMLGLVLLFTNVKAVAQSPWDTYFEHYTLTDKHLGTIVIHVSRKETKEKKPLLIYIDGSGNYPLFYRKSNGKYNTSVAFDIAR